MHGETIKKKKVQGVLEFLRYTFYTMQNTTMLAIQTFSFSFWSEGNITNAAKKAILLQAWTGQRVSEG